MPPSLCLLSLEPPLIGVPIFLSPPRRQSREAALAAVVTQAGALARPGDGGASDLTCWGSSPKVTMADAKRLRGIMRPVPVSAALGKYPSSGSKIFRARAIRSSGTTSSSSFSTAASRRGDGLVHALHLQAAGRVPASASQTSSRLQNEGGYSRSPSLRCFATAIDLMLGVQLQTSATDFLREFKIYIGHSYLKSWDASSSRPPYSTSSCWICFS